MKHSGPHYGTSIPNSLISVSRPPGPAAFRAMNTELIETHCDWLKAGSRSAGTIRLRRYYLGRLAERHPLETVNARELLSWFAKNDWSPETRKSVRSAVRNFFGWAAKIGARTDDPSHILPSVLVPRALPRPAPEDILTAAIRNASERDRLMIMLAAYAGLRRAEIARLAWADIGPDSIRVLGKGGHERMVPLLPALRDALALERTRRRHGSWGSGWRWAIDPRSLFVFPGRQSGHLRPDSVGVILTEILGGAWTGHQLRHTFATAAYKGTKDLRAVQELLGHSKPETTARYTAIDVDDLVPAVLAAGRSAA